LSTVSDLKILLSAMSKQKLTRKEKHQLSRQSATEKKERESLTGNLQLTLGLIIAICGFLLYIQTLSYDYTLDDQAAITENRYVQKGLDGIGTILSSFYWDGFRSGGGPQYRVLSLLSFAIEWEFFPDNPAAGHFMNVFFYALTGFILFRLLSRLFRNNLVIPFTAALLFIAHPVHTEVVANIKSRDEIFCMLFSMLSLLWLLDFADGKKKSKLVLSAFAFFLALMSKENAITMIAIAPLVLYFFRDIPLKKAFMPVIPFALASLLYFSIIASIQRGAPGVIGEFTNNILGDAPGYLTRLATALFVLGKYILLLIFPLRLSIDYSYREISLMKITELPVLISVVILLAMVVYAVTKIKKKDPVAFGILYFFVAISLVSNLVIVIGTIMGDRLVYMPSLGFTIIVAVLLARLFKDNQPDKKDSSVFAFFKTHSKVIAVSSVLFLLFSFKTINRNPVWKNNLALMTSAVEDAPNSAYAHYLYGNELVRTATSYNPADSARLNALYDQVLAAYLKAIEIYPSYAEFYSEAAATYRKKKNIPEALKYYDLALKYDPKLPQAYNGKGVVYFNAERYSEAKTFFLEALKYNPRDGTAMANVGGCYLILKDPDNAISYLLKSLEYFPGNAAAMTNLGYAYEDKGDKEQANLWHEKAKQLSKTPR
jgi:Flp pilus assembly protein TadD